MSDTPKTDKATSAGRMRRLVRLVRSAIKRTNGYMLFDLLVYKEDEEKIIGMLKEALEWGTEHQAMKHVLGRLFSQHEETMKDAAQECTIGALESAINSLPNAQAMASADEKTSPKESTL